MNITIQEKQPGQQSINKLNLASNFIKQLTDDDFQFAKKQYQRIYSQQMGKLSYKILKMQKVKQRLKSIQKQQESKIFQQKSSINSRFQSIEKNKQKKNKQKLKTYHFHQQMWQSKVKDIRKKIKNDTKFRANKALKYGQQIEKFWKTKTQCFSTLKSDLQTQKITEYKKNIEIEVNTSMPEVKLDHPTKNSFHKKAESGDSKNVKFYTEGSIVMPIISPKNRLDTRMSNKTMSSHKEKNIDFFPQQTRKSFLINNQAQKKFSQNLYQKQGPKFGQKRVQSKKHWVLNEIENSKLSPKSPTRLEIDEKLNGSFQKTMKKLEKISKLKQKYDKTLRTSQISISPSKPRKSIDPVQYRSLRTKSLSRVVMPDLKKQYQNQQDRQDRQEKQDKLLVKIQIPEVKNYTTAINQRGSKVRLSMSVSRRNEEESKKQEILQEYQERYRKQKILKAIRQKITKIKMNELRKVKQIEEVEV